MGKRSARREEARRKLNIIKVTLAIFFVFFTAMIVWIVVINVKDNNDDVSKIPSNQIDYIEEDYVEEVVKEKTVEEVVNEFGGSIIEKVKSDTCYVSKDEKEYTVYSDGEILEGRIAIWDGKAVQEPKINDDGSIDIILPSELKWVADQVISGKMNFSGTTITLKEPLDLGARKTENGWEGPKWSSIVGFLDELPDQDENKNKVIDDSIVIDESVDVIQENLKRFAGVFNGNNKSIRGMNVESDKSYQGLFGFQTGNIENLIVKKSYVKGDSSIGAIVGYNTGTIFNCKVIDVEIEGNSKVGGIVGTSMTGSNIGTCSVEGNRSMITAREYVGGVVGYANNNVSIDSIDNNANVKGNKNVGGIAGIAFYGTTFNGIVNNGNVSGKENVAGIVGYSQAQIEKSYSSKMATIEGDKNIAGLVGINYDMGDVNNSYNESKIIGKEDNIGGIVGINNSNISNVYNKGKIDASNATGIKIGGICGQNSSESFINNSYNIGRILFKETAEGITGINYGKILNSYYLDISLDCESADKSIAKTGDELKNSFVSELFGEDTDNKNNGFPVLKW